VKQRGRKFGVIGTPTFFANGRKAQGATTYEEFKALVDPQSSS
jgi:protein-disulfide isomerase